MIPTPDLLWQIQLNDFYFKREKKNAACGEDGESDRNEKGKRNKADVPMYM